MAGKIEGEKLIDRGCCIATQLENLEGLTIHAWDLKGRLEALANTMHGSPERQAMSLGGQGGAGSIGVNSVVVNAPAARQPLIVRFDEARENLSRLFGEIDEELRRLERAI